MTIFRTVASLVMAAAFGFFGLAKIARLSILTDGDAWDRLDPGLWAVIGILEICAGVSLLMALHPRFRMLGLAAASGLVALTVCALVFHLANGDGAGDWAPALVQGAIATAYLVTDRQSRLSL